MNNFQKKLRHLLSHGILILSILPAHAQQETPDVGSFDVNKGQLNTPVDNSVLTDIKNELLNLGYFLGYPIDPDNTPQKPNLDQFFQNNVPNVTGLENSVVKQFISIISANVLQPSLVPSGGDGSPYAALNAMANSVLEAQANQMYNAKLDAPLSKQADQNSIPLSPVTQLILNTLSLTPDDICWVRKGSGDDASFDWKDGCPYSFTTALIYANSLGLNFENNDFKPERSGLYNNLASYFSQAGGADQLFPQSNSTNPQTNILNQVDSSIFLTPLVYNTTNATDQSSTKTFLSGLDTNNQVLAAESFIRNVTGTILPNAVPTKDSFDNIVTAITNASNIQTQMNAFKALGKYVLGTRVYASQESVAVQNIYEMMSKRMPYDTKLSNAQNAGIPSNPAKSSQALNEFIMATYRLYNPGADKTDGGNATNASGQSQWQTMIATASSTNVEREIALLLSELNYQLYLMRQQQEKLVLTNSVILLNLIRYPTLNPDQ